MATYCATRPGRRFLQRPLLFHNQPRSGRRVFRQASVPEDSFFSEPALGRGLAMADFDNDGWIDLAASRCNRPLSLLRNMAGESKNSHHWLGLHLARRDRKPLAGATVRLTVAGQILTRFSKSGGSYLSSSDPRELFGLVLCRRSTPCRCNGRGVKRKLGQARR